MSRRWHEAECPRPAERPAAPPRVSLHHSARPCVSEPGYCPVRLGMTTGRLQSGVNTLQGFKEDKRNKVTPGEAPAGASWFPSPPRRGGGEAITVYLLFSSLTLGGVFPSLIRFFIKKKLKDGVLVFKMSFVLFFPLSSLCGEKSHSIHSSRTLTSAGGGAVCSGLGGGAARRPSGGGMRSSSACRFHPQCCT